MIRLVTIDCWDTILENSEEWDLRFAAIAKEILFSEKMSSADAAIRNAFHRESLVFTQRLIKEGITIPLEERLKTLSRIACGKIDTRRVEELGAAFDGAILDPLPVLISGADRFLSLVKDANVKLCLISNTGWFSSRALTVALRAHKVATYFDHLIFSDTIGVAKPSTRIFEMALLAAGCSEYRSEVVHVGDDLVKDVAGAQSAGLRAIHFHRGGNCRNPIYRCSESYDDLWKMISSDIRG